MKNGILWMAIVLAAQGSVQAGDLLVSSRFTNNILRYDPGTGAFKGIFASDLGNPNGIAYGPDGHLYVGLGDVPRVMRVHGRTGVVLGEFIGPSTPGGLTECRGLAFGPDENLYVASGTSDNVLKYHGRTGAFLGVAAQGNGLNGPVGIAFGPEGNLYVGGALSNRVYAFDPFGAFIRTMSCGGLHSNAVGVAVNASGRLLSSQSNSDVVLAYNTGTGTCQGIFASGGLDTPIYMTIAPDGNLLVGSFLNNSVLKFDSLTGQSLGVLVASNSGGLSGTHAMAFMPDVPVPAASTWGLVVFSLLLMIGGTVFGLGRRERDAAS